MVNKNVHSLRNWGVLGIITLCAALGWAFFGFRGAVTRHWQGKFHYESKGVSYFERLSKDPKAVSSAKAINGETADLTIDLSFQLHTPEGPGQPYALQITTPKLSLLQNGLPSNQVVDDAKVALQKAPYLFTLDADQRVNAIYTTAEHHPLAMLVVRNLLSQWRADKPVVEKESYVPMKDSVQPKHEPETGGVYVVYYQTEVNAPKPEPGFSQVNREWYSMVADTNSFVSMPGRTVLPPTIDPWGSATMTFNRRGELVRVDGIRTLKTEFGGQVVGESEEKIRMSLTPDPQASATPPKTTQGLEKYSIITRGSAEDNERAIQEKELGNLTWADLEKQIPVKFTDNKVRVKLFLKLRALFYLQGSMASVAAVSVAKTPPQDERFLMVVEALAATGTPEAQSVIVWLFKSKQEDPVAQEVLLRSITQLPNPRAPLLEQVRLTATEDTGNRSIRYTAQLVWGSLIHRLQELNPDLADGEFERMEEKMQTCVTTDDQLNLLYAIGNAARPEVPPAVTKFLASPEPVLRAAAVHALRLTASPKVEELLWQLEKTETAKPVKEEIQRVRQARKSLSAPPK